MTEQLMGNLLSLQRGKEAMSDVPEGYKISEMGVIPGAWEVKSLDNIGSFKKGKNIPKKDLTSEGVPCVLYGEIYTKYNFTSKKLSSFIPLAIAQQSTSINKGDILFAGSGETADEIGKCFAYLGDEKACAGGDINILSPFNDDSTFLGYLLNSPQVNKQKSNLGQGSSVVHIYSSSLKTILIPSPPLPEQQAIASALSDVDALITALEQLITKKRNIKQGAMQQLLTGKKRLPGFGGAWEVKRLGAIAEITMGQSPQSAFYNTNGNGIPLIQGNADIGDRKTIIRIYTSSITKKCKKGDIIMSVRAPVGEIAKATFDACLGRGVCAISAKNDYLYHNLIFLEDCWARISKGSTFDSINSTDVIAMEIKMPPTDKEQHAIAQILGDMDAEIESLEKKRDKYKAIKQGMMQELLTGKTRLV